MANAAATTPQPGCVCEGECESSVSSAWPSMPFASAALTAAVTMRLPATQASFAPPRVFANEIAFFPGGRGESDSIAARVRSEEHTPELQSQSNIVCRLLLEKKKRR